MKDKTYRILDANINRLREALRVIEEYLRFVCNDEIFSGEIKKIRHGLKIFCENIDYILLLKERDSINDIFSDNVIKTEKERTDFKDIVIANFKRAQEAARVLEEYSKLLDKKEELCIIAKQIRFKLYSIEKDLGSVLYGQS